MLKIIIDFQQAEMYHCQICLQNRSALNLQK